MLCPECELGQKNGQPLKGVLEVELNGTPISDDPLDYLPVEREFFPDIPVGNTPLWHPVRLFKKHDFPELYFNCLLYTSPSPRDLSTSRMPSSA